MNEVLDFDEDDGIPYIDTHQLAVDLWAVTRSEKRPVKDDSWRNDNG